MKKKLKLKKSTLRVLSGKHLAAAGGGGECPTGSDPETNGVVRPETYDGCPTAHG